MNSKTNKALFTWLGTNDLKDTQRTEEESYGAITSILKDSNIIFNHIVILSNRKNKEVEDYLVWLNSYIKNKRLSTKVDIHYCTKNTNPTDYNFIYQQSELVVKPFDNQYYELYFNITSGTSAMSATWLLLGTSIFKAHLIQSSKERGVEFVFYLMKSPYKKNKIRKYSIYLKRVLTLKNLKIFQRLLKKCRRSSN